MHTNAKTDGNTPELSLEVQALINNGLEFLDKAREELQASKPKFSIVSFWTAVEILLKVPLVHEHWTLVCSGKKIVRSKYLAGDFQSVTYDETCARLGEILESPLPKETMTVFDKIRQHRNRVVHFYHKAFTPEDQSQILEEQADAWFALNRLMRDDWSTQLGGFLDEKLDNIETDLLTGNEYYAGAKFRRISPQLKELTSGGIILNPCVRCRQTSYAVTQINPAGPNPLTDYYCHVCLYAHREIKATCPRPECQSESYIRFKSDTFECPICQHNMSRYELLHESQARINPYSPAGCTGCGKSHSVCQYGEKYLCTYCLTVYDRLEECQHCHHYSNSVELFSEFGGCSFCKKPCWDDIKARLRQTFSG